MTAPRALALTGRARRVLAHTPPPVKGRCSHCGQLAYVWDGRVACVDRTAGKAGRYCPGNDLPPLPDETAMAALLDDITGRDGS